MNPLNAGELAIVDRYIAARRQQQAGALAADALSARVLAIVRRRQAVERNGARVCLDYAYTYHYSRAVGFLEKTLREQRELERSNGTAKATTCAAVAFVELEPTAADDECRPVTARQIDRFNVLEVLMKTAWSISEFIGEKIPRVKAAALIAARELEDVMMRWRPDAEIRAAMAKEPSLRPAAKAVAQHQPARRHE